MEAGRRKFFWAERFSCSGEAGFCDYLHGGGAVDGVFPEIDLKRNKIVVGAVVEKHDAIGLIHAQFDRSDAL